MFEGKSQPVSSRCSVGSIGFGCSNPKFWLVEAPLVGSIAFHLGQWCFHFGWFNPHFVCKLDGCGKPAKNLDDFPSRIVGVPHPYKCLQGEKSFFVESIQWVARPKLGRSFASAPVTGCGTVRPAHRFSHHPMCAKFAAVDGAQRAKSSRCLDGSNP